MKSENVPNSSGNTIVVTRPMMHRSLPSERRGVAVTCARNAECIREHLAELERFNLIHGAMEHVEITIRVTASKSPRREVCGRAAMRRHNGTLAQRHRDVSAGKFAV